mgnify:CR=1 FL=1
MNASFFKRLFAFLIDSVIVSIIVSIITMGFTNTKYKESYQEYEDLLNKYISQEITMEEYMNSSPGIYYDLQQSSVVISILTVALSIAYYIVFQYMNRGQTLGKKILGIRVVEKNRDPSLKAIILRTIIIQSMLSGILDIVLLYVLNQSSYFYSTEIISLLEMTFIFVSALFILYRKDKLGLHDMIAHTQVIDERGE